MQENCGRLADKYIEYDPVIVLVDLVLLAKPAYRHLLYNSDFNSYWKLLIVLILGESFRKWSSYENEFRLASANSTSVGSSSNDDNNSSSNTLNPMFDLFGKTSNVFIFQGERTFYFLLVHTTFTIFAFVSVVVLITELRWFLRTGFKPVGYKTSDLIKGLIIGGSAKLLGLLGVVWQHVAPEPHQILICGYTMLSLLTAYCSGKINFLSIS